MLAFSASFPFTNDMYIPQYMLLFSDFTSLFRILMQNADSRRLMDFTVVNLKRELEFKITVYRT